MTNTPLASSYHLHEASSDMAGSHKEPSYHTNIKDTSISHYPTPFFTQLIVPMDANGNYYPTFDPYGSFGLTPEPEPQPESAAASMLYGGGSGQVRFDDGFLELGDWMEEDPSTLMRGSVGHTQNSPRHDQVVQQSENTAIRESSGRSGKKEKIAFKTKSDIEILDDGFKWRKYGKKMVKNSPNPRNYYRCSVEGCPVKKRVERDREDNKYVITTYEGTHNHEGQGPSQF